MAEEMLGEALGGEYGGQVSPDGLTWECVCGARGTGGARGLYRHRIQSHDGPPEAAHEVDVAHLLAERRAATDELRRLRAENERLHTLYRERTAHLTRVMAERDELLAARGIEHHGSEAT